MKKFLLFICLTFFPFFFLEVIKANEYEFLTGTLSGNTITFSGSNSDGTSKVLNSFSGSDPGPNPEINIDVSKGIYDEYDGKIYFTVQEESFDPSPSLGDKYLIEYDLVNNNIRRLNSAPTSNMILYPKGITQMITEKSDGSIHIGENSAVFKEENGREKFWAQDANGKSIPIDITNGSKLLINGRDVEQSINNVGALSAALTGLPTVPADSTLACGLGTGTHGGDFAFSGGCASKVNDKLSINYAASMTMPGQDYAGDLEDAFSARAGFVWKLGKSVNPNLISMKENQKLTSEITDLKSENKKLNKKITKFETEKSELLARLERLEKIALRDLKSKDLAVSKLK